MSDTKEKKKDVMSATKEKITQIHPLIIDLSND